MASFTERLLWNIYIIDRNSTTFKNKEDVPNYTQQILPIFLCLFLLEDVVYYHKKKKLIRLNDGMTSVSLGMIMELVKLLTNGIELTGYEWLYQRRFIDLDWQSAWTWWGAAIGVDFCYYWVHRATHEISLFWCSHQVHHSSEEYNLFTAVRQSAFQHLFSIGFYQPLALLGIPLPALLVHLQFNLFFQFWIHTEMVSNLGPLEWVFNTASHHRVHHGINKWCLDKNYAGFLIIWDRMFGTFEAERKDEKIVYGLVSQPQTFEPLYLQLFYFKDVILKSFSMNTWKNMFRALFCGPGWNPGTPRLGDESAIPSETPPREKYNPLLPTWVQGYLTLHLVVVLMAQQMIISFYATFTWFNALSYIALIFFSLFTFGKTLDRVWWAPFLEVFRCGLMVVLLKQSPLFLVGHPYLRTSLFLHFVCSGFVWAAQSAKLFMTEKMKDE